ncbi:MAG: transporter related [Acidimicrobiales bacterium]|nr:transporter related [Acidimicrobiales bacterium]
MLLELEHVRAGYGTTEVLRGIDLAVDEGGLLALLGPNGAGKSTTLKVIAGILHPSAGTVRYRGRVVGGARPADLARAGMYLVPEGRAVFPSLTVTENLRMATGAPERQIAERVVHALELFPRLAERRTQVAGTMSGGEQRMLALARAFVADPLLLLLDEPSLGLAPMVIDEVFATIARFTELGVAVVLVEQYVHRALAVADHVLVLSKGSVTFAGSAADVDADLLAEHYLATA